MLLELERLQARRDHTPRARERDLVVEEDLERAFGACDAADGVGVALALEGLGNVADGDAGEGELVLGRDLARRGERRAGSEQEQRESDERLHWGSRGEAIQSPATPARRTL